VIHVPHASEPPDFDVNVRRRGEAALLELIGSPDAPKHRGRARDKLADRIEDLPGRALPDFWTAALPSLRTSYHDICAYLGMYIDPATGAATVDHFKPKSKYPELAYEWDNFRFAARQPNSDKGDHEDVLDPFEVQDGWFVLDLLTFEVDAAPGLAPATRDAVLATRRRLKLNEPTYCQARRRYNDLYHGLKTEPDDPDEPLPLSWLLRRCPFVALELHRQGRLRAGDTIKTVARAAEAAVPASEP
jgi:hypothetical protein